MLDKNENITIESNEVFYLKDKEIIYTKGKSTANNGVDLTIEADDYFKYNKLTTLLEARGDVFINDVKKNTTIKSNEVFYLRNKEKIYTKGKTKALVKNKYKIKTSDLTYLRIPMMLSSLKRTFIEGHLDNLHKLEEFQYSINKETLKGKETETTTNYKKAKSEKYFFNYGFFDFKNQNFQGKDINIVFDKMMYDEIKNDPRLKGVYGSGDEFFTYINKGVYTTCKKTDKCPPWLITSKKVTHDKRKKRIIYDKAWLKIYDVPVVYFPKFFHPDPTVKRQSGFLRPRLINSVLLDTALYTPYFLAISESQDMTIKPRIYDDGKFIFQSEYRQKTAKTYTHADFSYAGGWRSKLKGTKKNDTRTHLFTNTLIDLDFDDFSKSTLKFKYENTSRDSYLKLYELTSPLLLIAPTSLETKLDLTLEHEEYDFSTEIAHYETLGGSAHDRHSYTLPSYTFSKSFFFDMFDGSFGFTSSGNNTLKKTNIVTTNLTNDLNYSALEMFSDIGFKSGWGIFTKNLNSVGKKDPSYKNSPQSEFMSAFMINTSIPMTKKSTKTSSSLNPQLSFRFSPHQMKNHSGSNVRITASNVHNFSRLGIGDSYEEGASLTLGINYKIEKNSPLKEKNLNITEDSDTEQLTKKINQYFDFKLATVLRNKEEINIPTMSTLNRKTSNIFGEASARVSDHITLNHNFSLDNDLNTFEFNEISSSLEYNNFEAKISFLEENGSLGNSNSLGYEASYVLGDNTLKFKTRRNRTLGLTEYYDLIYQYKNDCLTAGVEFKKKFYKDGDIIPTEELFFSITIIPLGTFSPAPLFPRRVFNEDFRKILEESDF